MIETRAPEFARAGSQRWLQMVVHRAPHLLDVALRESGALDEDESATWISPLLSQDFRELRDEAVIASLELSTPLTRPLSTFWPPRGPVWDGLAKTSRSGSLLVEAKAHIAEAASPGSKASEKSLEQIVASLSEARQFYAPNSTSHWHKVFYQYANRLAFHYFLRELNKVDARLVFLDFLNATDVQGPTTRETWEGATRLLHAALGLPASLKRHRVYHAYVDVRTLSNL